MRAESQCLSRALRTARVGKPPKVEAAGIWARPMGKARFPDYCVDAGDAGSNGRRREVGVWRAVTGATGRNRHILPDDRAGWLA